MDLVRIQTEGRVATVSFDTGVKAKSAGREKFMAAVAMNALGMLIH